MCDQDQVSALLSARYGARATCLTTLREFDDPPSYRVSVEGGETWVPRLFPRSRPLERVEGDARILAFLGRVDFPAERLIRTVEGSVCCDLGGHGAMVTSYIPGVTAAATVDDLTAMGSLLGRLMTLAELPPEARRRAGSLPQEDLAYGRRCLDGVEGLLPIERRPEWETVRRSIDATSDLTHLPEALVHPDCQPGNAVRRPDGRLELIDWAGAGTGPRVAALGVLLSGGVLSAAHEAPDRALVEAVMDGFSRHVRLAPEEIAHLPDAIRYRPLVLAARDLAINIRSGDPAPSDRRWRAHQLAEPVAHWAEMALRRMAAAPDQPRKTRKGPLGDDARSSG